jgi:hypothetical protein
MPDPLRILYVGPDYPGSNGTSWRNAFVHLGHEVRTVDEEKLTACPRDLIPRLARRLRKRPTANQIAAVNREVLKQVQEFKPNLTFYVKAYFVLPETVEASRRLGPAFAWMNDDMFLPGLGTFTFRDNIRLFDCIFTTKSFNVPEYHAAGAPLALYIPNSYDPEVHFPTKLTARETSIYGCDVGFVGMFSPSKADALSSVARRGDYLRLNVWGGYWERMMRIDYWHSSWRWRKLRPFIRGRAVFGEAMSKAICGSKIALGLLCREVRDLHTCRSFEIPACSGFMLAERTEEHQMYFKEDAEAVYFSSYQEMMDKVWFYLGRDSLRQRIAEAGYARCLQSGASIIDRARYAIEQYRNMTNPGVARMIRVSNARSS